MKNTENRFDFVTYPKQEVLRVNLSGISENSTELMTVLESIQPFKKANGYDVETVIFLTPEITFGQNLCLIQAIEDYVFNCLNWVQGIFICGTNGNRWMSREMFDNSRISSSIQR